MSLLPTDPQYQPQPLPKRNSQVRSSTKAVLDSYGLSAKTQPQSLSSAQQTKNLAAHLNKQAQHMMIMSQNAAQASSSQSQAITRTP